MNYAQSTVTMQIQRLEQELGFPLFERIGRKNYLTAAGQAFLPHATEMLHIMQKVSTLGQDVQDMRGTLRIGVLESLMFGTTLEILPSLRNQYPNVDVLLKIGQASELLALLKQNQLDVIYISNTPVSDSSVCCCYRRKELLVFIAGPEHPLVGQKKIPMQELMSYPFIVAEPSGRCYGRLHEIAAEWDIELRHSVIVDDIRAITMLLHDGQSISFLPRYSLLDKIESGELVQLDADILPQTYYSQLIYHKNKWISPYMQTFIDLIREARPEDKSEGSS